MSELVHHQLPMSESINLYYLLTGTPVSTETLATSPSLQLSLSILFPFFLIFLSLLKGMRACGSQYNWIPHISLQPAVKCPDTNHHATFPDKPPLDPLRCNDSAKSLTARSLSQEDGLTPSTPSSPGCSWSIIAILEHVSLSVVKEEIAIKTVSSPPIRFNMEMGCGSKTDCVLGRSKSPSVSSLASPFGCTSISEETEVQSMELVLNKEVSPSDSPTMESNIADPQWKDSELYSFLFDGHDTDTDDDGMFREWNQIEIYCPLSPPNYTKQQEICRLKTSPIHTLSVYHDASPQSFHRRQSDWTSILNRLHVPALAPRIRR